MDKRKERREKYLQDYLADYRKRHHEIKVTFSNTDYAIIKKIAEKQGMKPAVYIRNAVHEQTKHLYLFPLDVEEQIKQAVRNMRGIGNTINQLPDIATSKDFLHPIVWKTFLIFSRRLRKR
jgi:hypothetical protein